MIKAFNNYDKPCDPVKLVDDYNRSVREVKLAYKPEVKAAAIARRNLSANLVITEIRVDPSVRVRVATAQCAALGNDSTMLAFKAAA